MMVGARLTETVRRFVVVNCSYDFLPERKLFEGIMVALSSAGASSAAEDHPWAMPQPRLCPALSESSSCCMACVCLSRNICRRGAAGGAPD